MANNDQIILDQIIEEQRQNRVPTSSKPEYFEIYVAEQVLKDYDLSDDEIESGLTGGGNDGGIDGIYTFANGELVQEDFDSTTLKKNVLIEVVIIQAKTSAGFNEDVINKLKAVTENLFQLSRTVDEFKPVYNEGVRSAVEVFRHLYSGILSRFPTLHFRYIYASRGDSNTVSPNVVRKKDDLGNVVTSLFSNAKYEFNFCGASDLLALARRQPIGSYDIEFTESLSAKDGYIALVPLKEFIRFIRAEDGQLRKSLFEANVRDYQGNTQVNEDIQRSLTETSREDFWWLNNGITVVASKAVQGGKVLTIEDPQIVNGQQTSTEIFNYFRAANTSAETRCVMVRVIVATIPASRDRIIKATNSQTSIPAASLRATEKIHRDIEEYLAAFQIFYDRRKNSQKQLGKPTDKIISIALLAQAVMAISLQRPADARARPSSLIKKEEDYNQLFNDRYPIALYLIAAKIIKAVHSFLRTRDSLAPKDRANLLFYVAMHVAAILAGKANPTVSELANIKFGLLTDDILQASLDVVAPLYQELGANDQVAKGTKLLTDLKQKLGIQFQQNYT